MGRTLRNLVACSMIAGSLLFNGCGIKNNVQKAVTSMIDQTIGEQGSYDKALKNIQNTNSAPKDNQVKEKPAVRGLDFYFFQGDELKFITLAPTNIEGFDTNPSINYTKNLKGKDGYTQLEEVKILNRGCARYIIPKIEDYSEDVSLLLSFIRFETQKDREKLMEEEKGGLFYPLFVKGDIFSFIAEDGVEDPITNLSEKQKLVYINLIFDYAKRTGMKAVLAKSQSLSDIYLEMYKEYRENQYKLK